MKECLGLFAAARVNERFVWDATGRINVLHKASDETYELMREAGCREVALGIEPGDAEMLRHIDKRITPQMTTDVVRRLTERGIKVKGYFILGFPTESIAQIPRPSATSTICGRPPMPLAARSEPASLNCDPIREHRSGIG